MAEGGSGGKGPTNFWDVVLHLVQRFPVFAITLTFIGAGLYVGSLVLADKNQAERELLAARQSIESERLVLRQALEAERRQMQAEIERERREAQDAIARAVEREKAADVKVAQAEAQALLKVRDTLLDTASRIQELVKSQLGSMEDIDALRVRTVETMKTEMANLETQREAAKKELEALKSQARTSELTFSINALEDSLKNSPYAVNDAIARVTKFLNAADASAMEVLNRRINGTENQVLRGSLQYAAALVTRERSWVEQFVVTLSRNPNDFGEPWLDAVLGCCDTIEEPMWSTLFPNVTKLVANDNVRAGSRLSLLGIFANRPGAEKHLFASAGNRNRDDLWKVVEFAISVVRGEYPQLPEYRRDNVLFNMIEIDPAAAHVWANRIIGGDGFSEDLKSSARSFLQTYEVNYPIFEGPPPQRVTEFWTRDDLATNHADYAENGTDPAYLGTLE